MADDSSQSSSLSRKLEHAATATTRSALALLVIATIGVVGVWLVNNARITSFKLQYVREKWHSDAAVMLCRHRLYEKRDSRFYQALAWAALEEHIYKARISVDVPCSSNAWSPRTSSESGNPGQPSLSQQVKCFGDSVATVLKTGSSEKSLDMMVGQCFRGKQVVNLLKKPQVIQGITRFDDADYKPERLQWIMLGSWPKVDWGFMVGGEGTSFGPRFNLRNYNNLQLRLLYRHLAATSDAKQMEAALSSEVENAYKAALQSRDQSSSPSLSVPGLGSPMKADDILVILGPLIFLFQASFYLNWRQEEALAQRALEEERQALSRFPRFSSPADPFAQQHDPLAVDDICARLLWLSFLTLPILVLTVGTLFRYDLQILLSPPHDDMSWMSRLHLIRSPDWVSWLLDLANLGALYFSVWVFGELTVREVVPEQVDRSSNKKNLVKLTIVLFTLFWVIRVFATLSVFYNRHSLLGLLVATGGLALFFGFGALWIFALKRAVFAQQPGLGLLAALGIAISFGLLL